MTNRHSSRAPRVLYLAFYLPPSRASGVFRARATANHLAAQGWDVTAFAAPLDFLYSVIGTVDEQLAETLDPRVTIERPKQKLFAWERDIRQFSAFRRNYPLLARKLYEVGQRLVFPEHYASWGRSAVRLALRRHLRERFDVVLATGNPFASLAAAWTFHRLTGVPYVVDYRDSWTLNLFTDAPAYEPGHPAWGWERRILRDASGAVFVNNALRSWHASRYPRRRSTPGRVASSPVIVAILRCPRSARCATAAAAPTGLSEVTYVVDGPSRATSTPTVGNSERATRPSSGSSGSTPMITTPSTL